LTGQRWLQAGHYKMDIQRCFMDDFSKRKAEGFSSALPGFTI